MGRASQQYKKEERFFIEPGGFFPVIAMGFIVILISIVLDLLWAQVIPFKIFYHVLRAPGVIVHECAHVLGCLLTGARIRSIVLFSQEGGSVTYNPPMIPVIGNVVISTAPLLFIPLVLTGCTWIFSTYLGCSFSPLPLSLDSAGTMVVLGGGILGTFTRNLVQQFNPWFLLYLYLTVSLILSVAPSMQDINNAVIGICILALAGALIAGSRIPWAVAILAWIMRMTGTGFTLGLGFGLIALVISSPLIIVYIYRHTL
jgi:hypothetical protein